MSFWRNDDHDPENIHVVGCGTLVLLLTLWAGFAAHECAVAFR